MTGNLTVSATLVLAVAAALSGGALFAFSSFVMRALGRVPAAEAIRAMQAINVAAINPLFMMLLFGTGVVAIFITAAELLGAQSARTPWVLAATLLYVAGVVLVTIAANVPLNNRLAQVESDAPEAASEWMSYASRWIAWNHLRSVAGAVSALLFFVAAL